MTKPAQVTETAPMTSPSEEFVLDREKHIVINNRVYLREDLPENVRQLVGTVNFTDGEIAKFEQNLQVLKYGRDRLVGDLIELMNGSDIEALAEVAPPAEA